MYFIFSSLFILDLASLITTYIDALRNENPIQCESAYAQAAQQRNKRVFHRVMQVFKAEMDKGRRFRSKHKLQDLFLQQYEVALTKYRDECFVYEQEFYEDNATVNIQNINTIATKYCKIQDVESYYSRLNVLSSRIPSFQSYRRCASRIDFFCKSGHVCCPFFVIVIELV